MNKLLDENPGCSLLELKLIVSKRDIDITMISTNKLQNIVRRYIAANRASGFDAILKPPKTKASGILLRECCEYSLNIRGIENKYKYVIWASPSQIARLNTSEHW